MVTAAVRGDRCERTGLCLGILVTNVLRGPHNSCLWVSEPAYEELAAAASACASGCLFLRQFGIL